MKSKQTNSEMIAHVSYMTYHVVQPKNKTCHLFLIPVLKNLYMLTNQK